MSRRTTRTLGVFAAVVALAVGLIVVPAGERPADVVRLSRNLRRYGSTNPLYVLDSASANDPDLIHT